ncbi:hypothetical protein F4775DRAFT_368527 [Biscogniauxia sp. FL1348]|nr:hypothetical protein F4775DRAFT_368527 [Biscogniauxia sp. FL1348]
MSTEMSFFFFLFTISIFILAIFLSYKYTKLHSIALCLKKRKKEKVHQKRGKGEEEGRAVVAFTLSRSLYFTIIISRYLNLLTRVRMSTYSSSRFSPLRHKKAIFF